jgi:hypothetical protein
MVPEGGWSSRGRRGGVSGARGWPVKTGVGEALTAEEEDDGDLVECAGEVVSLQLFLKWPY